MSLQKLRLSCYRTAVTMDVAACAVQCTGNSMAFWKNFGAPNPRSKVAGAVLGFGRLAEAAAVLLQDGIYNGCYGTRVQCNAQVTAF